MNWYKKAGLMSVEELKDFAHSCDHSLLQCVECGRWIDFMKQAISDWKFEKEMSEDELKIVSETREAIENGKGRGLSTCKYCVSVALKKDAGTESTMSVSPSIPIQEEVSISVSPRQIYTRDDVIQEREDIVPSMLKKKKKKKRKWQKK